MLLRLQGRVKEVTPSSISWYTRRTAYLEAREFNLRDWTSLGAFCALDGFARRTPSVSASPPPMCPRAPGLSSPLPLPLPFITGWLPLHALLNSPARFLFCADEPAEYRLETFGGKHMWPTFCVNGSRLSEAQAVTDKWVVLREEGSSANAHPRSSV